MTTKELIRRILNRLNKFKFLLLAVGCISAVLLYLYAKQKPAIYTVRATFFPLTAPKDNSANKVAELLGGGAGGKSLSDEANVSIEEVANSKVTREAVAGEQIPSQNNKTVAEVLIAEYNRTKGFLEKEIKATPGELLFVGSELLKNNFNVKFNKNNLLEIYYSSTDMALLVPVENILIEKISRFYRELKIEKARSDYQFIDLKVDSFDVVLRSYDSKRIRLDNTTLFVSPDKLQYTIPQENLAADKMRVVAQRNAASATREDALWRLQKETPIIKILDKPGPPFSTAKPSGLIYGIAGFMLGLVLTAISLISGLLYKFANAQVDAALAPGGPGNITTTA